MKETLIKTTERKIAEAKKDQFIVLPSGEFDCFDMGMDYVLDIVKELHQQELKKIKEEIDSLKIYTDQDPDGIRDIILEIIDKRLE